MQKTQIGTILILISAASFGAMAIFTKYAYLGGANITTALFVRFLVASSIFWLFLSVQKIEEPVETSDKVKLLFLGMFGYATVSGAFFNAVNLIPASLAAMLLYLYPALVYISNILLKYEKISKKNSIALFLTLIGTYYVVGPSVKNINILGIASGILSAVAYCVYVVFGTKLIERVSAIQASAYIISGASILFIGVGFFQGDLTFMVSPFTWMMMIATGIISTVIAIVTFWIGVDFIGSSKASIISSIEPLVTTIFAYFLFNEHLTKEQLTGGFLILCGVLIIQWKKNRDQHVISSIDSEC